MKDHPWFNDFPWDDLLKKKLLAPFIPPLNADNFDAKYTNSEWKDANSETMQQNQGMLKRPSVQKLFSGYYHDEHTALQARKEAETSSVNTLNNASTTTTKTKATLQAETCIDGQQY